MKCSAVLFLCLSLLLVSNASIAEPLPFGKLFTTVEERSSLNRIRAQQQKKGGANIQSATENTVSYSNQNSLVNDEIDQRVQENNSLEANKISLSGFIVRSDGKQKIWLNGKQLSSEQTLNFEVSSSTQKDVTLTTGDKKISLKVGQKWLEKNNTIIESYNVFDKQVDE